MTLSTTAFPDGGQLALRELLAVAARRLAQVRGALEGVLARSRQGSLLRRRALAGGMTKPA